MVAILVFLTVIVFLAVDLHRTRRSRRELERRLDPSHSPTGAARIPVVHPEYRTPPGVFFDHGHTWAFVEESGSAKLGIDDFLYNVVGRIDDVETLPAGTPVLAGGVLARLSHGDRSVDVRSPMDGVVEEVNEDLLREGRLPDSEPYTESWLYRIKPKDVTTLAHRMLIGSEARGWLDREVRRLKVFLSTLAPEHPLLGVTSQDGGMPVSGLIEHLSDEDWIKLYETFLTE